MEEYTVARSEQEIMSKWDYDKYNEPLITVWSLVYNHCNYLVDLFEGFLSQETTFPFQVFIHDDCSTDGGQEIIRRYEKLYPHIIHAIYEEENQYSKKNGAIRKLRNSLVNTKYTALCEGDDYWIDSHKLEKQVMFMEEHPDCVLTLHNGFMLNVSNGSKQAINPFKKSGFLDSEQLLLEKGNLPPTASMIYNSEIVRNMPQDVFSAPVGDRPLRMYLITRGSVYYFDDLMCIYRTGQSGNSFDSQVRANSKYAKEIYDKMVALYHRYDEYTNCQYSKEVKLMISREKFDYDRRIGKKMSRFVNQYYYYKYPFTYRLKEFIKFSLISVAEGFKEKRVN